MSKSDSLFALIKAMTKAEKRYFKVENSNSTLNHRKDYIRLFCEIETQKEYDEEKIKNKFKGEPYFRQLSSVKVYLHRQIIKSLNNFYQESSITIKINNFLTEIEVLYSKGLFINCAKSIKRAKNLALKYEKRLYLLILIDWETRILSRIYVPNEVYPIEKKLEVRKEAILGEYIGLNKLNRLDSRISQFFSHKGFAKTRKERADIHNLLSDDLLKTKYKSFDMEINRLNARANCYMILANYNERFSESKKGLEYFQSQEHRVEEYINSYFNNLVELANLAIFIKKYAYAEKLYETVENIYLNKYDKLNIRNRLSRLDVAASLLDYKGNFESVSWIIVEANTLFENHSKEFKAVELITYHCLCFHLYFRIKDFKNVQYHILQILNSGLPLRWDIQALSRIVYLIVQYEEQEYLHLGYALRSTYRYLRKKQMLEKPEQVILDFIKKAPTLNSQIEVQQSLNKLRKEFLSFKNEPFIASFPLIEWIDSKLQNRELSEIVKENYLKFSSEAE